MYVLMKYVPVCMCVCIHMCFQTETKIMIRGKGSVKENKFGKGAQPMPGEDESLHALVIASSPEALKKGVDKVHKHTDIQTDKHTHAHARMHAHTHTRTHACTHTRTHACIHTRTHACMHTHTHTCMHTHTHTRMHAHQIIFVYLLSSPCGPPPPPTHAPDQGHH